MLLDKGRESQHAIESVLDYWKDEVSEPCDYVVELMVKSDTDYKKFYTKEIIFYNTVENRYMFLHDWLPEGYHAHLYRSVPVHRITFD